jgi:hypothetical protein
VRRRRESSAVVAGIQQPVHVHFNFASFPSDLASILSDFAIVEEHALPFSVYPPSTPIWRKKQSRVKSMDRRKDIIIRAAIFFLLKL